MRLAHLDVRVRCAPLLVLGAAALAIAVTGARASAAAAPAAPPTYDPDHPSFVDPTGDNEPGAADITNVAVAADAAGLITIRVQLASGTQLAEGDSLALSLNTDGNSTGCLGIGAEYAIVVISHTAAPAQFQFLRCVGGTFADATALSLGGSIDRGAGTVEIHVKSTEIGGAKSFLFALGALHEVSATVSSRDLAPDDGLWRYDPATPPAAGNAAEFPDGAGDGPASVPDISRVVVSNDAVGHLRVRVTLSNRTQLADGDGVAFLIDGDRKTATGCSLGGLGGLEHFLSATGQPGNDAFAIFHCVGSTFDPASAQGSFTGSFDAATHTVVFTVDAADIGDPGSFSFYVLAYHDGVAGADVVPADHYAPYAIVKTAAPPPIGPDPQSNLRSFVDPTGDNGAGAPDIGAVDASSDDTAVLLRIKLANRTQLPDGDSAVVWLNTDSSASGCGTLGAEYSIVALGTAGAPDAALLHCVAGAFEVVAAPSLRVSFDAATGTLAIRIGLSDVAGARSFLFAALARHSTTATESTSDPAPSGGLWRYDPTRAQAAGNAIEFPDALADGGAAAPDISNVAVSNDAAGRLTVRVYLANRTALNVDDSVGFFLDTDQNSATGCLGNEYILSAVRRTADPPFFALVHCVGGTYTDTPQGAFTGSFDTATNSVVFSVAPSDIGNVTRFVFAVVTGHNGTTDTDATASIATYDIVNVTESPPALLPTTTKPPSVTTPPRTVRVKDRVAPRVRALRAVGKRGKRVKLRYRVFDASGVTREEVRVYSHGRLIAKRRNRFAETVGTTVYYWRWRVPKRVRPAMRFCVSAWDRAGNRSKPSCAPLRLAG